MREEKVCISMLLVQLRITAPEAAVAIKRIYAVDLARYV
jgi:hypothetical protein